MKSLNTDQDSYSDWFARLLKRINGTATYAITIGQTTLYSEDRTYVDAHPEWSIHETQHKLQWAHYGVLKLTWMYFWQSILHGYENNPFEAQARLAAAQGALISL